MKTSFHERRKTGIHESPQTRNHEKMKTRNHEIGLTEKEALLNNRGYKQKKRSKNNHEDHSLTASCLTLEAYQFPHRLSRP